MPGFRFGNRLFLGRDPQRKRHSKEYERKSPENCFKPVHFAPWMSNVSPRDTEKSGYGYTNNAIDRETSGSDGRAWKIRTDDGNLPKRAAPGNLAPGLLCFFNFDILDKIL